jgi:hypothetical protein
LQEILDNPDNYKADVSGLASGSSLQEILDNPDNYKADVSGLSSGSSVEYIINNPDLYKADVSHLASGSSLELIPTNPLLTNDTRIPDMIASASLVENIEGTSASTIWTYGDRELTSYPEGTSASEVWTYGERYLTSGSNLDFASGSSVQYIIDNPDLYKADVSGLAQDSTLESIMGAGWSNETLVAIKEVIDSILVDTGTDLPSMLVGLQNWLATEIEDSVASGVITQIRGNTWNFEIDGLTLDDNLIQFVVKKSPTEQDSQAYLKIDNVTGLRVVNGSEATDATKASVTYAGSALTIQVDADITSVLTAGTWFYGIQYITSSGLVSEPYGGSFTILKDIVRSVQ